MRKEGSGYDLPLAIGMLASLGRLPSDKLGRYVFVGELGLDGSVRPVKGALSIAIKAREQGSKPYLCQRRTSAKLRWSTNSRCMALKVCCRW